MPTLTLTALSGIPLVQAGDDLAALTLQAMQRHGLTLAEQDVLVYASKVISKAEGRFVRLRDVMVSAAAHAIARSCEKDPRLVELILQESREVLRVRPGLIIVEHRQGFVCANAGIDHSNVADDDDMVLLLPADADASARSLQQRLRQLAGVNVAIVINDSHGRAWRLGTVGVAVGVAGLLPLADRRGQPDLFDRPLQVTMLGIADEIAAAASLIMGGAAESAPIVHARGVPYTSGDGHLSDLLRPRQLDMFR